MSQALTNTARRNESALVEQEIISSTGWLIGIRWIAGVGVLVATACATIILGMELPAAPLYAIGAGILVYNALFFRIRQWALNGDGDHVRAFTGLAKGQILLDYVAMAGLIQFSGGMESPAVLYYFFHIIIAAILFSPRTTYYYATLAVLLVLGITGLEYVGVLPHVHVQEFVRAELYRDPIYLFGKLFFFITTAYAAAFLASTLNSRMRKRTAEVVALSDDLQRAYGRLETLYNIAQAANSTLELQAVLDSIVKGTAQAMGVRACSIRLLDDTGTRLDLVAVHGLSPAYVQKGDVVLENSPLSRQVVLNGQTVITNRIDEETGLQYPSAAQAEGIQSMLSAPLRGKGKLLGLMRAYATESNGFTQEDAVFLTAIASQGSIAIENALAFHALGKLDQIKSKFVLTVTHELRSPVSVIRSLLRTLTAGYSGELSAEQRDTITRALRRTDFLQALIDDLLDLAAGKSDLSLAEERVDVVLCKAVERTLEQFRTPAEEKHIRLEWICQPAVTLAAVSATNEGMERVLGNLISNAIKYTPAGGCVSVTLERENGKAVLRIADTGIGIPPEAQLHLFEEFYRAPNAKAIEREGTGLGLAITRDLVENWGGRISVESQVGRGTTVTIRFPTVRD